MGSTKNEIGGPRIGPQPLDHIADGLGRIWLAIGVQMAFPGQFRRYLGEASSLAGLGITSAQTLARLKTWAASSLVAGSTSKWPRG
jgi:hypothetical protein